MFCVMWFDTASSSSEPVAASAHHSTCRAAVGGASAGGASCVAAACAVDTSPVTIAGLRNRERLAHPASAHSSTNAA